MVCGWETSLPRYEKFLMYCAGQVRYLDAQGYTSVKQEDAKALTHNSTMWIASCTKLMTTIAALQCVEKGLLSLDDDISAVLPEWKERQLLAGFDEEKGVPILKQSTKKLTLRHLLTHSSGMGYEFISPDLMRWRTSRGEDPMKIGSDGNIVRSLFILKPFLRPF